MNPSTSLFFMLMFWSSLFGMRQDENPPTPSYRACPCNYHLIYNCPELIDLLNLLSKQPFEPYKPELKQEAQEMRQIYKFLLNQQADEHIKRLQDRFESYRNSQKNS